MDRHTFSFSVKANNNSKPQTNPKTNEASKISRQKRVFGAARSTNIQTRPVTDNKSIDKPKFVVPLKPERKNSLKMSTPAPVIDTTKEIKTEAGEKELPQKVNTRVNKNDEKSLNPKPQKGSDKSNEKESEEPQIPVVSHPKTTNNNSIGVSFQDLGTEASEKKELPENINTGVNKKDEKPLNPQTQKSSNKTKEKDSEEPQTPLVSHSKTTTTNKNSYSKLSATPFYSAQRCSKCRFDKLETPSYWIEQIKLAESVGKHFVAVDFFRLAIASQAEPIRNLRIELKKYLSRHVSLSEHRLWREVGAMYGLWKPESNTCEVDSITEDVKSINCNGD